MKDYSNFVLWLRFKILNSPILPFIVLFFLLIAAAAIVSTAIEVALG